jgi:hypothetical protein
VTSPCTAPITAERLLDYLLGDLPAPEEEQLEAHVFACASCAAQAERLAALAAAVRAAIPPILTRSRLDALESGGAVAHLNVMSPGGVAEVFYPPPGKLLVHRLEGARLEACRRLDVALRTPAGEAIGRLDDVPFDAPRGEVLVACQSHFAELFPHDVVFVLETVSGRDRSEVASYTVLHRPGAG